MQFDIADDLCTICLAQLWYTISNHESLIDYSQPLLTIIINSTQLLTTPDSRNQSRSTMDNPKQLCSVMPNHRLL